MSKRTRFHELSNDDLDRYFESNPHYHPAISKNELSNSSRGKFTILNMQDSNKGHGTHWVLLYDVRPDEVIYFDSMGSVPPKKIASFLKSTGKEILCNPLQLQAMGSIVCGYWTEMIADLLNRGESLEQIYHHFSLSSPSEDDKLIRRYFSSSAHGERS
jgi:hypothetical protein